MGSEASMNAHCIMLIKIQAAMESIFAATTFPTFKGPQLMEERSLFLLFIIDFFSKSLVASFVLMLT
jgi:hypothetical protein